MTAARAVTSSPRRKRAFGCSRTTLLAEMLASEELEAVFAVFCPNVGQSRPWATAPSKLQNRNGPRMTTERTMFFMFLLPLQPASRQCAGSYGRYLIG